jgi:hypothetical protein
MSETILEGMDGQSMLSCPWPELKNTRGSCTPLALRQFSCKGVPAALNHLSVFQLFFSTAFCSLVVSPRPCV